MGNPVKIKAKVLVARKYGDSLYEYLIKPEGRIPRFNAGQFLHLALDPYDPSYEWPESRVFSIASGNTRTEYLRIVISVKGKFTTRIANELYPGAEVFIKMPYGNFTIRQSGKTLVLIAGGSGVAPFVSFLESAIDHKLSREINFFYGYRSPELDIFHDLWVECKARIDGFNMVIYDQSLEIDYGVEKRSGILNIVEIFNESEPESEFYLSGPWSMIDSFNKSLLSFGVNKDSVLIDEW